MIRAVLQTITGPVVVLGIVEENVRRMRDGQPLHADPGQMLSMAGVRWTQPLRLAVAYGETHCAIVDEMGGVLSLPPGTREEAERLDAQLREEGLL